MEGIAATAHELASVVVQNRNSSDAARTLVLNKQENDKLKRAMGI
ncbi:MAG TPA: hypothetical protein VF637_11045 [Sphingomicrobium sp.]|jgi:hypothetical protein